MTRIFISHSHSDEAISHKLVNFLLAALRIEEEEIFCSSNPDQGLDYRFNGVPDQLKEKLKNSSALIVLITSDSLHSAWIPFEAGSFWTTDKTVIPILGPGLTHDDLPGPLRSLLSIPIDVKDWRYKVNNAINQLVAQLKIEQKVSKRRDATLGEFFDVLRAWQSKRPSSDPASQEEIEELRTQIQEQERSHNKQLQEMKATSQQEKSELEQNIQLYQSQIRELEQQLEQARSLTSEKGVYYHKLRDLLAAGNWKEADQETAKVMLEAAGRESTEYLSAEDLDNFPCEDLRTINQLWLHYSDGKFGFSVQKEIYKSLGGTKEYNDNVYERFGDRVGWRKYENWVTYSDIFDMPENKANNAKRYGHLPSPPNYQEILHEEILTTEIAIEMLSNETSLSAGDIYVIGEQAQLNAQRLADLEDYRNYDLYVRGIGKTLLSLLSREDL